MKEKTVGVYCPSYRRSDCIMTQNILNDVTYVVRASEEEAYRNAGVRKLISAPDEEINTMSKVRQWILDNSPEDIIIQVDDDIKQILYRTDIVMEIKDPDVIDMEFLRIAQLLSDLKLGYATITVTPRPYLYQEEFKFNSMGGGIYWYNKECYKAKNDDKADCKEDVDKILQELMYNRIILMPKYLAMYVKKFTLVIDDKKAIPGINLHRKIILDYVDPKETVILVSFRRERMTENDMSQMTAYGYEEGKNLFYLKDMIIPDTLGLYSFLEHECGTDFLKRVDQSEFDYESPDATACGASRERSLLDMCQMPGIFNGKVLDFGCGKGAAIAIMKMAGIKEVDGVEQSHMLAEIARDNMKKLGENMVAIFNEDATEFTDLLDMYDTFYLYDPFRGETFKKVIKNIEESVRRKDRNVTIVYANPWLHREVEAGGVFKLVKQISTEFFLNIVNVYENE